MSRVVSKPGSTVNEIPGNAKIFKVTKDARSQLTDHSLTKTNTNMEYRYRCFIAYVNVTSKM